MIGITLIIFIRMDRSHMQSKWIGITLVNCYLKIARIVYYTTVVYVMYVVKMAQVICYINVSYTWHHMVTKISARLKGRLYKLRMYTE